MENLRPSSHISENRKMGFKFISVIVPAYNEQEYISQCLESLVSQAYPKDSYEIIVVDNDSKDKTREIALTFGVKVIEKKSGPVGAVRNAGAKLAKGELLAFIDADCVAPTDWLSNGETLLLNNDHVYGGGYNLRPTPFWVEKAWLLENKEPPKDLVGGCIFIRKKDFFLIGLFDEKLTSGEDTQLSVSLRKRNYYIKMSSDLNVIHLGNPTTLKRFFSRQIWHSENYFQNWKETRRDLTFYLLIFLILSFIFLLTSIVLNSNTIFFASLLFIFSIPLAFTFKRLRRSKYIFKNLRNLPSIYTLDIVYLSGRVIGLTKSLWRALRLSIKLEKRQED